MPSYADVEASADEVRADEKVTLAARSQAQESAPAAVALEETRLQTPVSQRDSRRGQGLDTAPRNLDQAQGSTGQVMQRRLGLRGSRLVARRWETGARCCQSSKMAALPRPPPHLAPALGA